MFFRFFYNYYYLKFIDFYHNKALYCTDVFKVILFI